MSSISLGQDITSMWDMIFPVRNGMKPNMKVGRNFNNETLKYATKAKISDSIVKDIVKRMRDQKFLVVEMNGGIGGMSTALLSNPKVGTLISFERNAQRRLWLKRNITAYNYGDRAIVPDIDEIGITGDEKELKEYKGSVFLFDPPWLPEDYKGGDDYKEHYILRDMKNGKYSLEEWLDKLKDTAYIVIFHLPPGYVLRGVPGWSYEIRNITHNSKTRATVYYCYNARLTGIGKKTKFNNTIDFEDISGALDDAPNEGGFGMFKELHSVCLKTQGQAEGCKIFVKYGFVDPEPFLEQYRDGVVETYINKSSEEKSEAMREKDALVSVSVKTGKVVNEKELSAKEQFANLQRRILKDLSDLPKVSKIYDEEDEDWMRDIQEFVFKFLSKFLKEENAKKLVTSENMSHWFSVFTHESIDLTDNYEKYETMGDKVYALNILEYVYQYGNDNNIEITPDYLTNFIKEYGSSSFLGNLGIGEVFYPWLRIVKVETETKGQQSQHVKEDLVESIFGALYIIGNKSNYGAGSFLAHKFFEFIFKGFRVTEEILKQKDYKTAFNQIFERIGLKDYTPKPVNVSLAAYKKDFKQVLEFTDRAYDQLKEDFPTLQKFITEAKGTSQEDVKNKIYEKAFKVLESYGITIEWADKSKIGNALVQIEIAEPILYKKVQNKLTREGYWIGGEKMFNFKQVTKVAQQGKVKIWQLIGRKEDQKGEIKISILGEGQSDNDGDARIEAFRDYLKKLL
jgi:dsRNA-specific ribonuclease